MLNKCFILQKQDCGSRLAREFRGYGLQCRQALFGFALAQIKRRKESQNLGAGGDASDAAFDQVEGRRQ